VLAAAVLVRMLGARRAQLLQLPAAYAIGGLATYWLLQRVLPMF
jgi:hypothetical protein